MTVKSYLNESLLSLMCFIIYGQGSFEKGLMCTVRNLFNCISFVRLATRIVCLVCTHEIEIGRVFASNSKYVVCFNKCFAGKCFCNISSLCEFLHHVV